MSQISLFFLILKDFLNKAKKALRMLQIRRVKRHLFEKGRRNGTWLGVLHFFHWEFLEKHVQIYAFLAGSGILGVHVFVTEIL